MWNGIKTTTENVVNFIIDKINAVIKAFNSIPLMPDISTIPRIGGGGGTVNPVSSTSPDSTAGWYNPGGGFADIPQFALGGIVTSPTMAMIGEAGPEAVIPLSQLGGMGGILITGNNFQVRDDNDINKIAEQLVSLIRLKTGVRI